MRAGKWVVLSISVDCIAGVINLFLDGKSAGTIISKDIAVIDGPFSVGKQICIFGSKNTAETAGANIKQLWFETRAFSQSVCIFMCSFQK